jgi:hypothetical protein
MKDDVILERLRTAADHFERMAAGTEPEVAMRELAPELIALLRDAADACEKAKKIQESWEAGDRIFRRIRRPSHIDLPDN